MYSRGLILTFINLQFKIEILIKLKTFKTVVIENLTYIFVESSNGSINKITFA